ncbi:MAG: hypothetical protein NZ742_04460 [Acidobacteria bacterium]|nr:hypothetical protein [Acidobacteriota bacterium]
MGLVTGVLDWLPVGVAYGLGGLVLGLLLWRSPTWTGRVVGGVLALLGAVGIDGGVDPTAVWVAVGLAPYFILTGPIRWVGALLTPLPFCAVWLLDALRQEVAAWDHRSSEGTLTRKLPYLRRLLHGVRGRGGVSRVRSHTSVNVPGTRCLRPGTFLWLKWVGLGLGGALVALSTGGIGPTVPAGIGAFIAAGVARHVWGSDVLRPVVFGSLVLAALGWADAGRAAGYTAAWLAWCIGWVVPSWLYGAWRGWPWESRRRAIFWTIVLAAFGWAWVGYWQENPCPSMETVWLASEEWVPRAWYGLQVMPVEIWSAGQAGQAGYTGQPQPVVTSPSGKACWSVPWMTGQALATIWEVFRQKPCDPTAMWTIDFQVIPPASVPAGASRRFPVCVWPWMNWVRWTFTATFPTDLTTAVREVRMCSETRELLEVRLVEARPVPPLLVLERLRIRHLRPHRYGIDVSFWNPGPRQFWGHVLVGLVSAEPGRASFRWLGVQRFLATIGPGDRLRQAFEATTVRFCGLPQVGIQVFETKRGAQGFAWAQLSPPEGTERGPLLPEGPPMCGPNPSGSEPKSLQPIDSASCPHTEP